jgi:hypothetical protein
MSELCPSLRLSVHCTAMKNARGNASSRLTETATGVRQRYSGLAAFNPGILLSRHRSVGGLRHSSRSGVRQSFRDSLRRGFGDWRLSPNPTIRNDLALSRVIWRRCPTKRASCTYLLLGKRIDACDRRNREGRDGPRPVWRPDAVNSNPAAPVRNRTDGVFINYTSVVSFHKSFTFFSAYSHSDPVYTPPPNRAMTGDQCLIPVCPGGGRWRKQGLHA